MDNAEKTRYVIQVPDGPISFRDWSYGDETLELAIELLEVQTFNKKGCRIVKVIKQIVYEHS